MKFLGNFWGILCIIFALGALLRTVASGFYNKFIRGLSKKSHRTLIDVTINLTSILEENHGVFGAGALISAIIHILIMKTNVGFSFWGLLTLLGILFVIFTGVINKFIYRDKNGELERYHKMGNLAFIFFLIMHLIFK